jgi:hypothetical protein
MWLSKNRACNHCKYCNQAKKTGWLSAEAWVYIFFFQAGVIKTIRLYKYSERQKKGLKEEAD